MDGASGAGPSRTSQLRQDLRKSKKEQTKGQSFNKLVQRTAPKPHLPRDTFFRPSDMVSDFRYRAAALPPSEPELADPDRLDKEQQILLENLSDTLDDEASRIELIACDHPTHNLLVMAARQIEVDLQSDKSRTVKSARRFTACIDEVCQKYDYPWREKGLSLDYQGLGSKKNKDNAHTLFKGDSDEEDFQTSQKHIFFPPWAEKQLGGKSLARVYELYWEVRQRLGNEDVSPRFDKEDFAAFFRSYANGFKAFLY